MHKINNLLDNLEAQIANYSILNQAVSEGNVGWHIVHSCLVIDSVCGAVCKSDATKFIKKFSFKAYLVLLVNSIFGDLNTADTFKLLAVHTNHHLKIIKDILK
jgi:hypothetical protein